MRVEWLILADAAQVVGGKLYLLGGAWDTLNVAQAFPVQQRLAVAVSFRIPWNETNQRHNIEIEILTEDGKQVAKIDGQVEVGRPPGIPVGSDQRAQIAADIGIQFDQPGSFSIIASIEGQKDAETSFRVLGAGGVRNT